MNEDAQPRGGGLHADLSAPPVRMARLTDCGAEGTCLKDDGSGNVEELDHIYASCDGVERIKYEPCGRALKTPHSDHSMIWASRIAVPPPMQMERQAERPTSAGKEAAQEVV
jgi:hypothetical protein